ncbi:MAG: DNA polymerase III subunit delta [Clostridia bacterium]|nr:DNA polymerase III subunit delta [Clostridia bacterium]
MAKVDDKGLRLSLKNNEVSNVYFVYGNEEYLKRTSVDLLLTKFADAGKDSFDFKKFDGKDTRLDDVLAAVESFPFMSEYSCILVTDFPFESLSDSEFTQLKETLNDMPQSSVLIFWQFSETTGKTKNQNAVIKIVEKVGTAVECNTKTPAEIKKILGAGIIKRGCTVSESTLNYIIEVVGDDLYLLLSETEKLTAYCAGGEVTRQAVDKLCSKSIDSNAFDVTKALVAGNSDKAFAALNELFVLREEPLKILGAIVMTYTDMYRVKVAVQQTGSYALLGETFACYKGKEFRLRNAAKNASSLSLEQLRKALEELNRADELLKTSKMDGNLVIEELIVRLLMI